MRFVRFGVVLLRLEREHLEMVREWRNSRWVRPNMRWTEFILPEQQAPWFESLDPNRNWYFVAHVYDIPFGLFHIKAIEWSKGCGESGGFVGDVAYIGRPEAAQATLALMDFAFLLLGLQSLEANYRTDLRHVVSFNRQLGYLAFGDVEDGFVRAKVDAERYLQSASRIRKAAVTLHGSRAALIDPDPRVSARIAQGCAQTFPDFELELA